MNLKLVRPMIQLASLATQVYEIEEQWKKQFELIGELEERQKNLAKIIKQKKAELQGYSEADWEEVKNYLDIDGIMEAIHEQGALTPSQFIMV